MSYLRTLVTLPIAAATAFLVGASPASAALVPAAPATATIDFLTSPVLDVPLIGACPRAGLDQVLAVQRTNWMWAPLPLDNLPDENGDRKPLPLVLIPKQMTVLGALLEWRARHDLVPSPGVIYKAPGRQPANQVECTLQGNSVDGPVGIVVTGVVVTIPEWLDGLLAPIPLPVKP